MLCDKLILANFRKFDLLKWKWSMKTKQDRGFIAS